MTDAEYMTFLYDRAARRLGYTSYETQQRELDATVSKRRAARKAAEKADMAAWAKVQLNTLTSQD